MVTTSPAIHCGAVRCRFWLALAGSALALLLVSFSYRVAAITITVFVGFTLGNFLVLKMLGFTMAFAVLIDATIGTG